MPLHQTQKLLKVDEAMSWLQYRIVDHQAGVSFGSVPAGVPERPFYVKNKRHGLEEMLSNIKILRSQFCINVDDLFRGGKKDRNPVVFKL